jgi:hypothetical protein
MDDWDRGIKTSHDEIDNNLIIGNGQFISL